MSAQKAKFGEQVVNKFIEMILSRIVDAKRLQVRVKTNLKQLARGELDGLAIEMYGFKLRPHLRVAELAFDIGAAAVNLQSIKRKQIELLRPSVGSLRFVVTQEQLNTLLNAQFVSPSDKQPHQVRLNQVNCQLDTDSGMSFYLDWVSAEEIASGSCTITPQIQINGNAIALEQWNFAGDQPPSEFVNQVLAQVSDILSLNDIANKGTTFDIQQLNIESGKLTVLAASRVEYFPKD